MKIAQILEATLGGTARHVLDLCLGLRREGHEVHLIYNPRAGRLDAIFRAGLPALERTGVVLSSLDMPRSVGLSDGRVLLAIRRYLRRHGPFDVIHGHSSKGGAYARLAGLDLPGIRIYTPNALITTNPQLGRASRWTYALMERVLGRLGHGVIAVSTEESDEARALGIPERKVFLVTNGADVAASQEPLTREELGLPEKGLVIGFVGRLVPQKAPDTLLRAFATLAPRFHDLHLAMVGHGPLEAEAKALAQTLGIENCRIHWLGVLDGPSVMPAFDVFALPSLYEGFPYVLIEALALGLPIVTTAVGGAATLVEEGGNGFIVPVRRDDLFAAALETLIGDPDRRRRMGERSRILSGSFTAARMVEGNLRVYAEVTSRFPGRA